MNALFSAVREVIQSMLRTSPEDIEIAAALNASIAQIKVRLQSRLKASLKTGKSCRACRQANQNFSKHIPKQWLYEC